MVYVHVCEVMCVCVSVDLIWSLCLAVCLSKCSISYVCVNIRQCRGVCVCVCVCVCVSMACSVLLSLIFGPSPCPLKASFNKSLNEIKKTDAFSALSFGLEQHNTYCSLTSSILPSWHLDWILSHSLSLPLPSVMVFFLCSSLLSFSHFLFHSWEMNYWRHRIIEHTNKQISKSSTCFFFIIWVVAITISYSTTDVTHSSCNLSQPLCWPLLLKTLHLWHIPTSALWWSHTNTQHQRNTITNTE